MIEIQISWASKPNVLLKMGPKWNQIYFAYIKEFWFKYVIWKNIFKLLNIECISKLNIFVF